MEKQKLVENLSNIDIGEKIPGTVTGKIYTYSRSQKIIPIEGFFVGARHASPYKSMRNYFRELLYMGLKKYSGKGRYSYLKGVEVIALHSNERKRPILLFLEPLLLLVNSEPQKLLYGHLPKDYIKKYGSGEIPDIPNLFSAYFPQIFP